MPLREISNNQASLKGIRLKKATKTSVPGRSRQKVPLGKSALTNKTSLSKDLCQTSTKEELTQPIPLVTEVIEEINNKSHFERVFVESAEEWEAWVSGDIDFWSSRPHFSNDTNTNSMCCLLCGKNIRGSPSNMQLIDKHVGGGHHKKAFQLLDNLKKLKQKDTVRFLELVNTFAEPDHIPISKCTLKQTFAYYHNVTLQALQSKKPIESLVEHFGRRFLSDKLQETDAAKVKATSSNNKTGICSEKDNSESFKKENQKQTYANVVKRSIGAMVPPRNNEHFRGGNSGEKEAAFAIKSTKSFKSQHAPEKQLNSLNAEQSDTREPGDEQILGNKENTFGVVLKSPEIQDQPQNRRFQDTPFVDGLKNQVESDASEELKPSETTELPSFSPKLSVGSKSPLGFCESPSSDLSCQSELGWMGTINELDNILSDNPTMFDGSLDVVLQEMIEKELEQDQNLMGMPPMIVTAILDEMEGGDEVSFLDLTDIDFIEMGSQSESIEDLAECNFESLEDADCDALVASETISDCFQHFTERDLQGVSALECIAALAFDHAFD